MMEKSEEKVAKRLKFNLIDVICLAVIVVSIAGVFIWALTSIYTPKSALSSLYIRYQNSVVASSLPLYDSNGESLTYCLSFRRELKDGEEYKKTYESYVGELVEKEIDVSELMYASYDVLNGFYLVVSDSFEEFQSFATLYGPQVDCLIYNGGFRIVQEDSPDHICSNQGYMEFVNYPVVCLPNSMYFWIVNSDYEGPDA